MPDPLAGLDDVPWAALRDAYGSAAAVPGLLRDLLAPDPDTRDAATYALFGTVWHQGTVYGCSPAAVPYLAAVVAEPAAEVRVRAMMALLLAEVAMPETSEPAPGPGPGSDLLAGCRGAVAAEAPRLAAVFGTAPPAVRAALLGVFAAVGLPAAVAGDVAALEAGADPRLAEAARRTRALAATAAPPRPAVQHLLDLVSDAVAGALDPAPG